MIIKTIIIVCIAVAAILLGIAYLDKDSRDYASRVKAETQKLSPGITSDYAGLKYLVVKRINGLDGFSPEQAAYYDYVLAKQNEILFDLLNEKSWKEDMAIRLVNLKYPKEKVISTLTEVKGDSIIIKRIKFLIQNVHK
jgi:hypothetical protein